MASIEVSTLIRATPERVWEIIADLEGQRAWMVDVRRLEVTSEQKTGSGTIVEVTSELFGLPLVKDVMEITDWVPNREFGVLHRGPFKGTGAFVLTPIDGGTRFTWREDFEAPLGPLGELGHRLFVKPHLTTVFSRSLENVRRIAEGRAAEVVGNPHRAAANQASSRKKTLVAGAAVVGALAGVLTVRALMRKD
jgi:uncharacterized protein YndB with AHSA1/START domain